MILISIVYPYIFVIFLVHVSTVDVLGAGFRQISPQEPPPDAKMGLLGALRRLVQSLDSKNAIGRQRFFKGKSCQKSDDITFPQTVYHCYIYIYCIHIHIYIYILTIFHLIIKYTVYSVECRSVYNMYWYMIVYVYTIHIRIRPYTCIYIYDYIWDCIVDSLMDTGNRTWHMWFRLCSPKQTLKASWTRSTSCKHLGKL